MNPEQDAAFERPRRWWLWVGLLATALMVFNLLQGALAPGGSLNAAQVRAGVKHPDVVLYATSWCGYCTKTRRLFKRLGVHYTEYDIEADANGRERHRKLGRQGVPIILIGDQIVDGYDERRILQLLGPWLETTS